MNKFTEGLEQLSDGRYRIYENMQITKEDLKEIPIKEGTLVEGLGDKKLVKSYRFKIWQGNGAKNLNKRNYESVFEKVLNEKLVTLGGVNHPHGDEDLDPARVFSVQKNPMIEDGWLTIQIDLVGDYGQLVEDILEAGGPIGVSSSCLGRVSESGQIMPESFTLERYADWVITPSNNHMHFKSEMSETSYSKENSTKESTEKNNTIIENTKKEDKLKENISMTNEIKNLRLNLKTMIREADKAETVEEKLRLLEEVLPYCDSEDFDDLRETINRKVTSISESVQKRAKEADTLEESVNKNKKVISVKEAEVTKLKAITESIKKDFVRNKVILEKQTELKEEVEKKVNLLERDLQEIMEKNIILERDLQTLIEAEKKKDDKKDDKKKDDDKDDEKGKGKDGKKMTPAEVKANFIKNVVNKKKEAEDKDDKKKDELTDEEKAELEAEKEKKADEKKKKESSGKIRSFYIDAIKSDKSLRENRAEILACETLKEAQEMVLKLSTKIEKKDIEVQHENVDTAINDVKSVSSITERYRKDWGLGRV